MTKGEQIVALAMEKVSREGYPKLTEDHPFFGRLRAFMVDKHYWMGTATDLLTEMNDTVTPTNTVTKLLNKYWYRLRKRDGIGINFRRTNRRRIKRLLLRNHLGMSALVRDTLRPVCENLNYERKVTDYVLC